MSTTIPTMGLVYDVFKVLEDHGFKAGDDAAVGAAVILLGDLVDGYEGRINSARVSRDDYVPAARDHVHPGVNMIPTGKEGSE